MKPTIKELWLEYQQEKNSTLTQEQKEISQRLYDISEELTASFNKRQRESFDTYCEVLDELYSTEIYEAFEKGVSFAARFLLEATWQS